MSYLLYLYCVVEAGSGAHAKLQQRSVPGFEPNEPLFAVEAEGLVGAVSHVPEDTFQEGPLNALLTQLPKIAPYAVRHHEAIAALLSSAPAMIPMTLGAVYRSPEKVRELLTERGPEFRSLLGHLKGKREWGIKVFANTRQVIQAADSQSDVLRSLEAEASKESPGKAYLLRKQKERLVGAEADKLLARTLEAVLAKLTAFAVDVRMDPLPDNGTTSPKLVLKTALLLKDGSLGALQDLMAELGQAYGGRGLSFELDGPWAPYSFVGDRRVTA